jgi:hypothetical protein
MCCFWDSSIHVASAICFFCCLVFHEYTTFREYTTVSLSIFLLLISVWIT